MEGCKQMDHFWNSSNYREPLIQPLKVNSPKTKKPQPHVVHTNALEWSTRDYFAIPLVVLCVVVDITWVVLDNLSTHT